MKKIMILICAICTLIACNNDDAEYRPGLWTSQDIIETFPGDTVLVQGQVSNYVGLHSIEIKCDDWGINKTYELYGEQSKVFSYNYQMPVPVDAIFNSELKITVTDTEGTENKKTIVLKYLPDTGAPAVTNDMPWQVSVDYDTNAGQGSYNMALSLTDDRQLKSLHVEVPAISLDETIEVKGRTASVNRLIQVPEVGSFPMTVTVADAAGNEQVYEQTLVVMFAEEENPYEDYPVMWLVNASEQEDDYIDGYYAPMIRQDAYQYQGSFYADKDGYQLFFTAKKTMEGDLFGVSPYVSSKLMNNNGYVVPVTVEKAGYYGIWIDLQAHTYSLWSLDTSAAYTGSLTFSGCGFNDFGDWGTPDTEMTRDGFRYTQTVSQNGAYADTRQYYAARVSDWGWILRYWSDATGCGWWVDDAGYGGSVGSYVSYYDGMVEVTFDTAILWATIKKK